jgi:ABC-2 type transport system permease protein
VNPAALVATSRRVLLQLRGDRRTIALVVLVPCVLLLLMKGVFQGNDATFQRVGVPLVGIFPLVSLFLVTSIAMLRERTSGTLERLMTMPLAKADIVFGYGIAFALVAVVQAAAITTVGVGLLGLDIRGSLALVFLLAVLNAVLGNALGLFASAFANTEFQAVQFMPAFLLPQLLLCGVFGPREQMAEVLQWAATVLPMTYAFDGLTTVAAGDGLPLTDVAVIVGAALVALAAGASTLRRRTA